MKKILLLASLFTACAIEAFAYNVYAPNSFDTVAKGNYATTVYTMCEAGKALTTPAAFSTATHQIRTRRHQGYPGRRQDSPEDNPSLIKLRKDTPENSKPLGWKPPKRHTL